MRYRRLDPSGDMTFGRSQNDFWINQPEAVGQLVMTRLRLNYGEWFANTADGTPWNAQVLGERTQATRDAVVRSRVFDTQGVQGLTGYNSVFDPNLRDWTAAMTISTVYGSAGVAMAKLPGSLPSGAVPPGSGAAALGIVGGGGTVIGMGPANLTVGPRADVTHFSIRSLDPGRY
jgi:hypothetical protein